MRLQLPLRRKNKNAHTLSDGTVIAANSEYIGITSENARYIEDATLSQTIGVDADSKLYDDICPTRTGTVTSIVNDDILSFYDTGMDFDINEHLVDGSMMPQTRNSPSWHTRIAVDLRSLRLIQRLSV